ELGVSSRRVALANLSVRRALARSRRVHRRTDPIGSYLSIDDVLTCVADGTSDETALWLSFLPLRGRLPLRERLGSGRHGARAEPVSPHSLPRNSLDRRHRQVERLALALPALFGHRVG